MCATVNKLIVGPADKLAPDVEHEARHRIRLRRVLDTALAERAAQELQEEDVAPMSAEASPIAKEAKKGKLKKCVDSVRRPSWESGVGYNYWTRSGSKTSICRRSDRKVRHQYVGDQIGKSSISEWFTKSCPCQALIRTLCAMVLKASPSSGPPQRG